MYRRGMNKLCKLILPLFAFLVPLTVAGSSQALTNCTTSGVGTDVGRVRCMSPGGGNEVAVIIYWTDPAFPGLVSRRQGPWVGLGYYSTVYVNSWHGTIIRVDRAMR